ncbi:NUDIX hydrolase [Cellulophaga baltica]|uniref:NUDIX hydrolase n=1 Tax=Cellulophaga TaxID=104264 RepID=UPI001C0685AF|nr:MULTISPECIES: NUDIX hydrolase [Cellulophaga]MBU2998196.1 NUDIX hydrolase [Cellulophaga baltica]MDO6769603.1 NUDIX hydrolase [Cellulophaga sp. 1_MG-2023]
MDFRKRDNVTVDCVVFGLDSNGLHVLLRNRTLNMYDDDYPIIDDWIVTGYYVFKSKTLEESADLIFKEITGLSNVDKMQFKTYGNPNRMKSDKDILWVRSRGVKTQTMTTAYYYALPLGTVKLKHDGFKWFLYGELPELGFDHSKIVEDAYEDLKRKIMIEPIIFDFLPPKFTLNDLQFAYEAIFNIEIDNRNFRKKVLSKSYVVGTNEKRKGVSKKPSKLYFFSREIYDEVKGKDYLVSI